jgi:hemerythrin-like domain-containing protein
MKTGNDEFSFNDLGTVAIIVVFAAAALSSCSGTANNTTAVSNGQPGTQTQGNMPHNDEKVKMEAPRSIAAEHKELHEELEKAIKAGGKTGEAANAVEERLKIHFEKEEEFALPQLGLLVMLSEGKISTDMRRAIELSDKLKADLPKMLEEHRQIVEALNRLTAAAKEENKPQAAEFAEKLMAHAQNEEEVMYPTAILVGEYLKLKFK